MIIMFEIFVTQRITMKSSFNCARPLLAVLSIGETTAYVSMNLSGQFFYHCACISCSHRIKSW